MKGFTLIEIIIAVGIFSLVILSVFAVMDAGRNAWFTGDVLIQLRQDIINTFGIMEKELRQTRPAQISLLINSSSPSLTFKMPHDNNGDGTILDALGNIEWSQDITYALNANNQITRTFAGTTSVLANNIVNLQFSRPAAPFNLLQIDITARKAAITGRIIQDSGQIMIKMRN
jgi:prepilin-type N-terminal cleavage/methylation domain-containing protein